MKKLFSLSLVVLFTVSCTAQWGKKIKGNGNVTTIKRSLEEYDNIALAGWFDVDLISGKEGEITLTGESNLLEYIITEVKNGKLSIKAKKGFNLKPSTWNKGIKITVPIKTINAARISGSGDIVGKTTIKSNDFSTSVSGSGDITLALDSQKVNVLMSGSGDITLSGTTDSLDIKVSGSGDVEAYNLNAAHVNAQVSGSSDIQVTATKTLKCRVSGSGDISYKGNPDKVDSKTSGSGSISKR